MSYLHSRLLAALVFALLATPVQAQNPSQPIEFNRDIRPILSNHCFTCHGPDSNLRKADLRLDVEKDALADRGGYRVIVPGKPEQSELWKRITTTDKNQRMPPAKANKDLSKEQIATLKRWIEQGAKFQGHWSFLAVKRPEVPAVKNSSWVRNDIDRFILARLEKEGLQPSPEADRRTLIRRLHFDLIGLPPTPKEVDDFINDKSPTAYEKLVDRLLNNPHFGERLAVYWLDVVRYADSGGYHSDNDRELWLYRDYVIRAFNEDRPFDRFVSEQIAGDLLAQATDETRIASGFNRLLQTTEEGGAQPKEYTAKYAADRVRNTGVIFLGLTMGCAECHDHKYDPISTKEFYQFAAFFADIKERAVGRQEQTPFPSLVDKQKLEKIDDQLVPLQAEFNRQKAIAEKNQPMWEQQAKADKKTPKNILALLAIEPGKRNAKQKQELANYYLAIAPETKALKPKLDALEQEKAAVLKKVPTSLVSMSGPPRTVRVLPRGNWLDDSGEIVQPDVPAAILPLDLKDRRPSRVDLAKWLVRPENPLTARVWVNRLWYLMFGQGLVKSLDDFGAQGTWPTHPELLDWLASEMQQRGWKTKEMIRLMVTSSTYRQTSRVSPELKQRDPYNQLLARQGRFRLEAEFIRDSALRISGLLVPKIGGPSVKPYQPAGYWRYLNFPTRTWVHDKGENQYRRGLYTWWQRTFLHPSLLAFDATTREECTAERPRSNTPQQALVLLNDPTYVEASRVFAERIIREGGKEVDGRIQHAYRLALARPAEAKEIEILRGLYEKHRAQYEIDRRAAESLLKVGEWPTPEDIPAPELAAWTSVARVIMNLHETITRE